MKFDSDDIIKLMNTFQESIFESLDQTQLDEIKLYNSIKELLYDIYDLHQPDNHLIQSSIYYIKICLPSLFHTFLLETKQRYYSYKSTMNTFLQLKELILPEQRSKEWYELREGILTASSLADALGKGHFQTRNDLLLNKSSKDKKPFVSSWIMEWGVKYEDVAIQFYEYLTNAKIMDFGLVPHPEFTIFGASPDGICNENSPPKYIGRMLEIKCPPKREFTKDVPEHYWMQMQGQLETCNLEECDFLQVKIIEYKDINEYIEDKLIINDNLVEGKTKDNYPKGSTLTFTKEVDGNKYYEYRYCPLFQSTQQIMEWTEKTTEEYKVNNSEKQYKVSQEFWKIERYECTLVVRDRQWWKSIVPEIINFWEEVEYYRKNGTEELEKKIKERKDKYKRKKPTSPTKQTNNQIDYSKKNYILDSDSE